MATCIGEDTATGGSGLKYGEAEGECTVGGSADKLQEGLGFKAGDGMGLGE